MRDALNSTLDGSPGLSIIIMFGGMYVALILYLSLLNKNKKQNVRGKRSDEIIEILNRGLKNETINTLGDVYNVYKGVYGYGLENDAYRNNINHLLRQTLVGLLKDSETKEADIERIILVKKKVDDLIAENEELSPFAELPSSERSILNDILAFLEKGDNASVKRKVEEISISIQIRKEQLDVLDRQSKWSVPLAIFGVLLTITFGVWSFF